jgi:hypothetical protein
VESAIRRLAGADGVRVPPGHPAIAVRARASPVDREIATGSDGDQLVRGVLALDLVAQGGEGAGQQP